VKKALVILGAALLAGGSAGVAFAATTTSLDLSALTAAESHVVSVLHGYKANVAWKAEFRAAVVAQAAALAKVDADLGSSSPGPSGRTLLSASGTDNESTAAFTVGPGGWTVTYSYSCAAEISLFRLQVYQGTQWDQDDNGPYVVDKASGSDTEYYYDSGTFHIVISSDNCSWSVKVAR
jgi:hypothetical protein